MPLTSLELCDFKSYRGHQKIGPFSAFTCIVGSNGGGKSNLLDAVAFVLGVRSAHLRSAQLRELIYRGRKVGRLEGEETQDGEAEGAGAGEGDAERAWVMAVYEDDTGKEYRFQRTITLTGSSEYRLNGKVVPYSKYNEVLEEQNILVKAKNFLVFQGDVEAVASQSPLALSHLIDQISGSLELKDAYDAARAAQDRANDISVGQGTKRRTINAEIKQFKEQKVEAERFGRLQEERDQAVLQHLLWKLYHIEQGIATKSSLVTAKNEDLADLRRQTAEHDKEVKAARKEHAKAHKDVLKGDKAIKKKQKEAEDKKPRMVELEAKIQHSETKLAKGSHTVTTVEADVETAQATVARREEELKKVEKAARNAQDEARKLAESKGMSLSQADLTEYRSLKSQASTLAPEARQKLDSLRRDERAARATLEAAREKLHVLEGRRQRLAGENAKGSAQVAELEEKVDNIKAELASTKAELDKIQSERSRITQLETEKNEKLQDVLNQLATASSDVRESEREAKFRETLDNLKRLFPGVHGRVLDLCKPTQTKYQTAVATVLGRNVDGVVVDEESVAIQCIEYMKTQRAGTATFLPLDTLQVKPVQDRYRSFAKGARLAVDVIQYDAAVERAMHFACGSALVCDTMNVARDIVYNRGQEIKAVTLDGTVIHKSGLITGGQGARDSGKRFDQSSIDGLTRKRTELVSQLQELKSQKPSPKADERLVADVARLETSLHMARDELAANKSRLTGIQSELKEIEKDIKKSQPDLTKAEKAHDKILAEIAENESVVFAEEDKVYAAFCAKLGLANIREYEEREGKLAMAENEARVKFEAQLKRLRTQITFEKERLDESKARLEKLQAAADKETSTLETLRAEEDALQAELNDIASEVESLQAELAELQKAEDKAAEALEDVRKKAGKATKVLDKAMKEIATWNDEIQSLASERFAIYRKCKLEEIELPLESGSLDDVPIEENLNAEPMDVDEDEDGTQRPVQVTDYGVQVDYSDLDDDEREHAEGEQEYVDQIAKINSEIERMAPNMKAIDKLDDVEQKLADTEKEFEKARKDSRSARDEFQDIKKKRHDLYTKAFKHISEHIDKTYKELTKTRAQPSGGLAYLSLEDDDEPYNAGIKYHAMPPGKPFRDMDQLSGGEKTMAAMALLFAIHTFRPAPFFVLDEVDAALDNTNAGQIARYIRNHSGNAFQCLIISHRSSLFERADGLVGVYRNADLNSSQTLTLDLTAYDDEAQA